VGITAVGFCIVGSALSGVNDWEMRVLLPLQELREMSEHSQASLLRRYWWFVSAALVFGVVTVIGQVILG